jgi:hypothetical protein
MGGGGHRGPHLAACGASGAGAPTCFMTLRSTQGSQGRGRDLHTYADFPGERGSVQCAWSLSAAGTGRGSVLVNGEFFCYLLVAGCCLPAIDMDEMDWISSRRA